MHITIGAATGLFKTVMHDYREELNARLLEFIRTELDLVATMIETARVTKSAENYQRAIGNAEAGLAAVKKFEDRLVDCADRKQIRKRARELEKLMSSYDLTMRHQ